MTVRTRIAPSPTGDPHVGTAYIALFNYCFAKQHGGEFLLRIEDTDQARSTKASEQAVFDSLKWLGLSWDEGPDVGGAHGPYRQSERADIYKAHVQTLLDQGHAFYCYRTPEELAELREARQAAGGFTALKPSELQLPDDEVAKRREAGDPYVVRMVVPEEDGPCVIHDKLRGEISLDWGQVDAQILLKSDGLPTYHLANVVDDHLMQITHVIRGEEWINSAPKHQLLYKYFGWDMPELCHLPLLRNPDKSKLSKRKNPTSILFYQRMGFLPEALINYLGRMGWSMPDEREKFSVSEMIEQFDIHRVSLGGPIFDIEKLNWLNGLWLRDELSLEALSERLQQWLLNKETLMQLLPHVQPRMNVLSDFAPLVGFVGAGQLAIEKQDFDALAIDDELLKRILQFSLWQLDGISDWHKEAILNALKPLADAFELKLKHFVAPLFIAITGSTNSFSVMDAMAVIGPDLSKARLRHGLTLVAGELGKKQLKKLEKAYAALEL